MSRSGVRGASADASLQGSSMCRCAQSPDAIYWTGRPPDFEKTFAEEPAGNWVKLFRCTECGQYWSVDEWDKYQEQVAGKVADSSDWEAPGDEARKQLLVRSRGGLSALPCAWAGCKKSAVKGVALCADHLFETGARR